MKTATRIGFLLGLSLLNMACASVKTYDQFGQVWGSCMSTSFNQAKNFCVCNRAADPSRSQFGSR